MKNELRVVAGLVLALAAAGCGTTTSQATPVVARGVAMREPLADPRPYGAADTAFGLDVLGAWCRTSPQANLVLSPSSLASGLGMTYLGARGGTAQAMAGVLHLPSAGGQALEASLHARTAALRRLDSPGVTVDTSDQGWTDPSLTTLLTGLGMGLAFSPAADFSALSAQACCIGLVKQAATLQVGEQGTTASAATAVGIEPTAGRAGPPPVTFDRPYLMVVTGTATGEPLFMARVTDPTA